MASDIIGLTRAEVEKSREKNGSNLLEKEKTKGFFARLLENLNDPIIKILILALIIEVVFTFGNCNLIEVFGIVLAIMIASTVSTVSELGSERAFLKMQEESLSGKSRVFREGEIREIYSSEIVVGDVVYLSSGERIPADGIILSGKISVDQSALNGESREVSKCAGNDDKESGLSSKNRVFSGSIVTLGDAVIEVSKVGGATYYGMVAKAVQTETRESPLKLRLSKLAGQISKIGYFLAVAVAIAYIFNAVFVDNRFCGELVLGFISNPKNIFSVLIHALTLMITVVVVAVPEGLPMMITVVLSANMKKMLKDRVLVKKLVGIETAGSMNILFTDKTGTVTTGEPSLEKIICQDATYRSPAALRRAAPICEILTLSAMYNTASYVSLGKAVGGNGTDRAILDFFKSEKNPALSVISKEAFRSEKKYSSVTLGNGKTYIKGAPEIILALCKKSVYSHGEIAQVGFGEIEYKLREESARGNRVVAVAYKESGCADFVFAALLILKDMVRRDTPEAIAGIKRAGVQIVMLTGDSKDTAVAIAEECGILVNRDSEIVLTSDEISKMSDEELKDKIPKLRVIARALPQDKTRLVRLSQELELVVGMTGDGINDAPSLKLADVGFAMGSGADIAKGAGDVIILNNSMYAINRTILYGRTIFKSIRKFITFQLIMNLAACGISLFGQLFGIESPITIIQMLWVNIIMDTLGGLAFAGEPALEYYMKEKPKRRNEPILTREMLSHIFVMGAYTLVMCMIFLKSEIFKNIFAGSGSDLRLMTAFYALFIFLGIFNSFTARCERMWIFSNIGKNKPFLFIMALISLIQIIIIYYGGNIFRTTPLLLSEVALIALIASSVILFDAVRRIFVALNRKKR